MAVATWFSGEMTLPQGQRHKCRSGTERVPGEGPNVCVVFRELEPALGFCSWRTVLGGTSLVMPGGRESGSGRWRAEQGDALKAHEWN